MKRIVRKLKSTAGFTLAETLLAVVILLLASSVVAAGMPAALNAYKNAIDAANAQVLLSSTVAALRSELTYAREVDVNETDKAVTYYSTSTGMKSKIFLSNGEGEEVGVVMFQYVAPTEDAEIVGDDMTAMENIRTASNPLLPLAMNKTTKDGKHMTLDYGVTEENGTLTFTNLTVKRDDKQITEPINLTIPILTTAAPAESEGTEEP